MQKTDTAFRLRAKTTISVDTIRRKIAIEYALHSIQWEPSITAMLLCKGFTGDTSEPHVVKFWEPAGHRNLDLLTISRRIQKQLCGLSKQSVYLMLTTGNPF